MKLDKKNISIQLLAIVGLGLAIKLAFIYYAANFDRYALSSFCSINDFVDCDGAARSDYSQFLGIPLAYWGIFFYLVVLFLTFVDKLKNLKFLGFLDVFKAPKAYIATLGTISFVVSMVLASISLFVIKKLCILCLITYFIDLAIALIASSGNIKLLLSSFKTTCIDFITGIKRFPKTFAILLITTISFLAFTGITQKFVPHIKYRNQIIKYHKMKKNPYRVKGNLLGNENAKVVITLYSDYVCPMCYMHNIMLHQAVKELKNIKIEHYNYPFDRECNQFVNNSMHPGACFMARGALAAKKQGNYWEMSSLLYENQPKTMKDMLKLAEQAGLDLEKFKEDINSTEVKEILLNDINRIHSLGVNATPATIIDGQVYIGVKPYYQLKENLKKHGAK